MRKALLLLIFILLGSNQASAEQYLNVENGFTQSYEFKERFDENRKHPLVLFDLNTYEFITLDPGEQFVMTILDTTIFNDTIQVSLSAKSIELPIPNNVSRIGSYVIHTNWSEWKSTFSDNFNFLYPYIIFVNFPDVEKTQKVIVSETNSTFNLSYVVNFRNKEINSTETVKEVEMNVEYIYAKSTGIIQYSKEVAYVTKTTGKEEKTSFIFEAADDTSKEDNENGLSLIILIPIIAITIIVVYEAAKRIF